MRSLGHHRMLIVTFLIMDLLFVVFWQKCPQRESERLLTEK